jgi:hypothetical protein
MPLSCCHTFIGHVTETLQDAGQVAEHAGRDKASPTLPDVRFAIQARASHYFALPPNRDLLLELATAKNACKS